MYGICQYDIIFVLQYSVVVTVRDLWLSLEPENHEAFNSLNS